MAIRIEQSVEPMSASERDRVWMVKALENARLASGRVAPNPAVGAVIVQHDELVGEGATQPPGGMHAEIVALHQAGEAARGATMYVTLEPCSHFGRTPPCVSALIEAGISRAVIAIRDPNPMVDGQGIKRLRDAGIGVVVGVCARDAAEINAGFIRRICTGLPEVHVKYAISLDGRIATQTGASQWITGETARQAGHLIRDRSDAIMIGVGTVLADNPRLSTRLPDALAGYGGPRDPLRVVLDSQARTPLDAAMLASGSPAGTLIAVGEDAPAERVEALISAGAEVLSVPAFEGHVDIEIVLGELGRRGINSVMVEGGARVIGSLADRRLMDRITAFIAPVILGGTAAPSPVGGTGVRHPDDGLRLVDISWTPIGEDFQISGYVDGHSPAWRALACLPES